MTTMVPISYPQSVITPSLWTVVSFGAIIWEEILDDDPSKREAMGLRVMRKGAKLWVRDTRK